MERAREIISTDGGIFMDSGQQHNPTQTHTSHRLAFLDGIRGLAALYVVFHHAYLFTRSDRSSAITQELWGQGRVAVDIFIVLSGFCLMLPVVQSSVKCVPGGFLKYFLRRAARILPAY